MKIIFMGTPDFSVPVLESIVEAGHEVALVVSQPDKSKGRSKELVMTPVKQKALEYGLEVFQPEKIRQEEAVKKITEIQPDCIVVVAFGQILPKEILDAPRFGCINVHASLLPKYRGAAPIQWAVIDGLEETGITTMYMDVGLDTGDMIDKVVVPIERDETGGSLFDKLAQMGGPLLLETLKKLEDGTAVRIPQDDEQSTYAKMLDRALGNISFEKSANEIERLIRGLTPWPSAYTYYKDKMLKIWKAEVVDVTGAHIDDAYKETSGASYETASCGQIVKVDKQAIYIKCGEDVLKVLELQLEGKKRMDTAAFLRGVQVNVGETLTKEKTVEMA